MDYLVVMGINDEGGASHGLVDRYAVITNKLSWGQERPFCEVPGLPDDPFCGEAAPAPHQPREASSSDCVVGAAWAPVGDVAADVSSALPLVLRISKRLAVEHHLISPMPQVQ